jgi:hypothetical protein
VMNHILTTQASSATFWDLFEIQELI